MTDTQQTFEPKQAQPAPQQPAYQPEPGPAAKKRKGNVLGIVALAVAAAGFIFACVPGALILGWILLPVGFTLGIIAAWRRERVKWRPYAAILIAVVGTMVGVIMFVVVVTTSFDNAFAETRVQVGSGDHTSVLKAIGKPNGEAGTRENPAAVGSTIEGEDWSVVINSVTLDATDAVLAANDFNDAPDAGTEYIIINYTATYTGDDPDGQMPAFVGIEYVTADGVTVDNLKKTLIAPDEIDAMGTLYTGASATGNTSRQVPSPADGVIAVRLDMLADKVFVAIQ